MAGKKPVVDEKPSIKEEEPPQLKGLARVSPKQSAELSSVSVIVRSNKSLNRVSPARHRIFWQSPLLTRLQVSESPTQHLHTKVQLSEDLRIVQDTPMLLADQSKSFENLEPKNMVRPEDLV